MQPLCFCCAYDNKPPWILNEDLENESFGTKWQISTPFTTAEGLTVVHTAIYPSWFHEDSAFVIHGCIFCHAGSFTLGIFHTEIQQVLMDFPATCLKVSVPFTCFCMHQSVTQRFISFVIKEKPSDPSDELFVLYTLRVLVFLIYLINFNTTKMILIHIYSSFFNFKMI